MSKSNIEWTDRVWNPTTGCSKVSAGCANCYALRLSWRHLHNPKLAGKYDGTVIKTGQGNIQFTGKINLHPEALTLPMTWPKPSMVFVNSMSDLFHENIPLEFISLVFSVMADIDKHTYQVLTKRPARMLEFLEFKKQEHGIPWQPSDNIWIGVSVEDQKAADERIPLLLQMPATVRFLSCEPLLGPVSFWDTRYSMGVLNGSRRGNPLVGIHWVIVGGESGPNARPMNPGWVRDIKIQCETAEVPFFFKQWGEYSPNRCSRNGYVFEDGYITYKGLKHENGALLNGQLIQQFPSISNQFKPAVC